MEPKANSAVVKRRNPSKERQASNHEKPPSNQSRRLVISFDRYNTDSKSKTTLSPKIIYRNRITRNKLICIPPYGSDLHMEEKKPVPDKKIEVLLPSSKPRLCKRKDRNLKDFEPKSNPFDLPKLMRTFYRKKIKKHTKPKTEPFIMSEPLTVCDIDEHFYKAIEGRPVRQFIDIKVYMDNLRDITLWRTNAAFNNEKILQIEHKYTYELQHYDKILNLYKRYNNGFVQFIKESYKEAKRIQDLAEEKSMILAKVIDRLEHYSFQYVKLRNRVDHMTFLLDNLCMYRRFLFLISPLTWRKEHDPLYDDMSDSSSTFTDLNDSENVLPPSTSNEKFRNKLRPDERAILYFKNPVELMLLFDELRKQCVTYVEIDVVTSKLVKSVVKCCNQLKIKLAETVKGLKEWIFSIETEIIYLEEREKTNKEAFEKLLMSQFQELYSSYENIKLFTCVQYVYMHLIGGHEEPKDSVATLMCGIETLYCNLNFQLDSLNQEVVKAAKKEMFNEDFRIMGRAHKAQRALTEYERLSKALYVSFEPPRNKMKHTIPSKKK